MAIDLIGVEELKARKARAAGTQPVKLTFDYLKKDPSVMQTIRRYSQDRYGTDYLDQDKALEDFLSEYRGIQNNTFKALTFANYASEIKIQSIKNSQVGCTTLLIMNWKTLPMSKGLGLA